MNQAIAARQSAAPVTDDGRADATADIIVAGGGGGGLPAALFSRWLGNEVILLEKAPEVGGTATKAAFWYWGPNNKPMQEAGIADPEEDYLRLHAPVYPGCAALSNEGDFVRIATQVGAELRNMNYAWMCPVPLEKSVRADPGLSGMFVVGGDSMLFVNKYGKRTLNEKLQYNELAQGFFRWDADAAEYPNLVIVAIWDQRSAQNSASTEFGNLIPPPGADSSHVMTGQTLEELAGQIRDRL